jgi:hypothetical protein
MARLYYRLKVAGKWNWKSVPLKVQESVEFLVPALRRVRNELESEQE